MRDLGRWIRLLHPPASGPGLGLLLALVILPVVPCVSGAAPAASAQSSVLSLIGPNARFVGPGTNLDWVWRIANHTDVARSVTLEIGWPRSWPLKRTVWGISVPANDTIGFAMPFSVPDTAAAGRVSVFSQVHLDADATPLDSSASVLFIREAPQAAVPVAVASDLVSLEWDGWLRWRDRGIVEVQRDGRGWYPDGMIYADEQGRCTFEDPAVTPGSTVDYRLRATVAGLTMVSAVSTVHVPALTPLAIAGLQPNPSNAMPVVAFTLFERASTRLEVYDLAGRRVWGGDLGVLAPGAHLQALGTADGLRSGIYLFRLTSGARTVSVRGVIAR